jgi:hypothetical protein
MKTLYALVLICFSLPAFAMEQGIEDTHWDSYYVPEAVQAVTPEPKSPSIDVLIDDDHTASVIVPASRPIEGSWFDAGADFNFEDQMAAAVDAPATKPAEHGTYEDWLDF